MANKISCILHTTGKCMDEVKPFDPDSWEKVKHADGSRQKLFRDSKYFSVKLPDYYGNTDSYHSHCYKSFTAVHQTIPDNINAKVNTSEKNL